MTAPLDLDQVEAEIQAIRTRDPRCVDYQAIHALLDGPVQRLLRIARAAGLAREHMRRGHPIGCAYRRAVDREQPSGYTCLDALDDALEGRDG